MQTLPKLRKVRTYYRDDNFDPEAAATSLIAAHGGERPAIIQLIKEAKKNRGQKEILTQRVQDLTSDNEVLKADRKAIPEGAKVLSKEEAIAYDAYVALGKPEELTRTIEKAKTLEADAAAASTKSIVETAAKAHGYNSEVLQDLGDVKGLTFEMGEALIVGEDGKKTKAPVAYVKDKSGTRTILTDYVEANLQTYLPALTAGGEGGEGGDGAEGAGGAGNGGQGQGQQGARWIPGQGSGGTARGKGTPGADIRKSFQEARDKQGFNPLLPKTS